MGFIRPSIEMNNVSDKMDSLVAKGNEFYSAASSAATMAKNYVPSFTPSAPDLATIESAKSSIQSALTSVKDSMNSAITGYQDAALEMQRKMKKLDVPMNKAKPPKLDAIYKDCAQMSIKGAINALPVPDLASLSCMKSLAAWGGGGWAAKKAANDARDSIDKTVQNGLETLKSVATKYSSGWAGSLGGRVSSAMDTAKSVASEIISKTEELSGEISKATTAINEAYENATTPDSENYIVPKVECTKEVWNLFIQENPDFATYGKYTWRDGYIIRKNNVD